MTLNELANESAFPNTFRAGVGAARDRVKEHIPSIRGDDEEVIWNKVALVSTSLFMAAGGEVVDAADFARRTCHCGAKIDGFYEYVDHLMDVLRD